ncbi:hypothetical protein NPIL_383801 [Nephila pilipes]|uniref:Uncharacterized protein n=1 Tax=Nephila pilipes TaxID=299642 RepID=A0A8X6QE37_NEPPI|nr:hypothetical protein NPIL_383801 [Nephila pilipes]
MSREKDGPGGENEIAIIPGDYKLRDHLTKEILRHLVPRVTITQSRGWRRRKGKAAALLRHLFASSKQASRGEGKNRKHNSQQQRNQCPIDWVRNSLVKSAAVKTGLKGGWERRKKSWNKSEVAAWFRQYGGKPIKDVGSNRTSPFSLLHPELIAVWFVRYISMDKNSILPTGLGPVPFY